MDGTPVSLPTDVFVPGTQVQLAGGDVMQGSVPSSITLQIISDPSAVQTSNVTSQQDISVFNIMQSDGSIAESQARVLQLDAEHFKVLQESSGEGEGQLLLVDNPESTIKQPGLGGHQPLMLVDEEHLPAQLGMQLGQGEGLTVVGMGTDVKQEESYTLGAERQRVADDIRQKIKELCAQLSDVGEESFLVTVRISDGARSHLGSIKGDHFCLLRQELVEDFHNFCLGIEEHEDKDELLDIEKKEPIETTESDEIEKDQDPVEVEQDNGNQDDEDEVVEEPQQVEDMETEEDDQSLSVTPKVLVMKKDGLDGKVRVDHEYTIHDTSKRPTPSSQGGNKKKIPLVLKNIEGPGGEDSTEMANILFLCDICKDVFADLKQLKDHKVSVHEEGDHHCTECSRVFTLKKNLERHLLDAHSKDSVNKFVCDNCIMDFISKEDLETHIEGCHNPELGMKCDVCEQTFPDIAKLMDHRKIHFDYVCFCSRCWQGFFDFLELEMHIQTDCQYKEALYKCFVCGKKYTKLHGINKHIDTHPIHSPFVCRMCGRGFDEEKDMKNHRVAAHIVRPYKCEYCEKTFKKRESVVEHRRVHLRSKLTAISVPRVVLNGNGVEEMEGDPLGFECPTCGIVLQTQLTYDQHMLGHTEGSEEHQCDHCDKVFFSRSLLIVHCRKDHKIFLSSRPGEEADPNLIACDWEGCNKTFVDRIKWKYHMKYHQTRADKIARGIPVTPQAEECSCPICGKVLKYKSYLKLHMAHHSGDLGHQCDICGTSYPTAKRLNDHIRVHKGEKPFKCRVCDKSFTSTSLRNQHMAIHLGSKTYICDICGKGFMSRKHFQDHMRIHNGEQPHKCETCGKDFIYFRSLVRHALTHIDPKERPKPYKCQYCGKQYTEVTGYKHHLRSVHTGETPFQCELCGEAFHRNDKLKRHMRARHNRLVDRNNLMSQTHIVTTRRDGQHGTPIIIKHEQAIDGQQGELQIVQNDGTEGTSNELHVDVIQDNSPQVFLIGLGNEGGETTYLQETQVIEGPDGTRYIIAGSGEELQVFESSDVQQIQEGDVIQNAGETITVLDQADQETLNTLANMASVAEIADVVQ